MLDELAECGMVMVRALRRKTAAAGGPDETMRKLMDGFGAGVRRTLALSQKIEDETRKTAEQRHAESLRRIEAQAMAKYRVRFTAIRKLVEDEVVAHAEQRGVPGLREQLLVDMHERLLDADIERATTQMDISAIILSICKSMGITPRKEIWSDALMAVEITRMRDDMVSAEAAREAREAAPAEVLVPEPQGPGEFVKIGGATFNPAGSFVCKDPPEPDESTWPEDILHRPPIDLLAMRQKGRPPDTG